MEHKTHSNKTAIVIVGPTAVGKTRLAIEIARYFNTEIISADSRQCFKEMRIGTAVPSPGELHAVPHHFIQSHSIEEDMNAGIFEAFAMRKANKLFQHKNTIVVCGGTGLYIKAFCEGIDYIPAATKHIERQIRKDFELKGLTWLQQQLLEKDPHGFSTLEKNNPQRLMRALSVVETTGKSIKAYQTGGIKPRPFNILKIGLKQSREQLWANIEKRTKEMYLRGLEKEAKSLYPSRHLNALQTVGYKEFFDCFEKNGNIDEVLQKIIVHTRQYAKRQMTWFRKDQGIKWFSPSEKESIISYINTNLI